MNRAIFRDKDKCVVCCACIIACKLRHGFPPHPTSPAAAEPEGINLINIYRYGPEIRDDRVIQCFVPLSCMHCADAPCIKACPRAAIYRDVENGVVAVDQDRCIGCKFCLWVCPYGAPRFNEQGKLELCDMCFERLNEGKKAACEAVCLANAIHTGTAEEIADLKARKVLERIERGNLEI